MTFRSKRRSTIRRYTPTEEEIKSFYKSREWAVTRYSVLSQHNGRCLLCGRSAAKDGVVLNVDHIKPIRKYWHLRFDSALCQVLCRCCNWGKGNKTRDWRPAEPSVAYA